MPLWNFTKACVLCNKLHLSVHLKNSGVRTTHLFPWNLLNIYLNYLLYLQKTPRTFEFCPPSIFCMSSLFCTSTQKQLGKLFLGGKEIKRKYNGMLKSSITKHWSLVGLMGGSSVLYLFILKAEFLVLLNPHQPSAMNMYNGLEKM